MKAIYRDVCSSPVVDSVVTVDRKLDNKNDIKRSEEEDNN
jgi:hypothetical protein